MEHNYKKDLDSYEGVEREAHVFTVDEVLNKAGQEVAETVSELHAGTLSNASKEARDAIVNILSVASKIDALPDESEIVDDGIQTSLRQAYIPNTRDIDLLKKYFVRNESVQALRGVYSRKTKIESLRDLHADYFTSMHDLLQSLFMIQKISYPAATFSHILQDQIKKFTARATDYRADINLKDYIINYSGFKEVEFKAIQPVLDNPEARKYAVKELARLIMKYGKPDRLAGVESRGYPFAQAVADMLDLPRSLIAKKGKLPGEKIDASYSKEYGVDEIEMNSYNIKPGEKIAIIDDLLATGGTMNASADLIKKVGGEVHGIFNVIQLNDAYCAGKREEIGLNKYIVESVVEYDE